MNHNTKGVVIVTGSGRGIGAATARLLGAKGYAVGVNYLRRPDSAEQVVADIVGAGGRAIAVQADTSDPADVQRLFERVDAELGPLTGLVNNAGITGKAGKLASYDAAAMRRVLDVNVIGLLLCSQQAVRRLSTSQGGSGGRFSRSIIIEQTARTVGIESSCRITDSGSSDACGWHKEIVLIGVLLLSSSRLQEWRKIRVGREHNA